MRASILKLLWDWIYTTCLTYTARKLTSLKTVSQSTKTKIHQVQILQLLSCQSAGSTIDSKLKYFNRVTQHIPIYNRVALSISTKLWCSEPLIQGCCTDNPIYNHNGHHIMTGFTAYRDVGFWGTYKSSARPCQYSWYFELSLATSSLN